MGENFLNFFKAAAAAETLSGVVGTCGCWMFKVPSVLPGALEGAWLVRHQGAGSRRVPGGEGGHRAASELGVSFLLLRV